MDKAKELKGLAGWMWKNPGAAIVFVLLVVCIGLIIDRRGLVNALRSRDITIIEYQNRLEGKDEKIQDLQMKIIQSFLEKKIITGEVKTNADSTLKETKQIIKQVKSKI